MTYSIFHSTKALQLFLELFVALALILALLRPRLAQAFFRSAEATFGNFASHRWLAILSAGVFPLVVRLLLLPFFPVPVPHVHDEFSYLLQGDTFAHGRAANPTPPYWEHFETEYELVKPAYASQYQPAQGLALAAGQLLAGKAWWGVWLTTGIMFSALCWALGFIMPMRWALFGVVLAALQFGVFGFWMNSYFGGAIAAIGGALTFGGILRKPSVFSAVIAATGIVIVIASRPAEGLIWLLAAACLLLARRSPRKLLLAFVVFLAAGLSGLAVYNARVTGNALEPPYALYRQSYGTPQSYWWQPPVLIHHFNNPELAANYTDQLRYWQRRYSFAGLWDSTWRRLRDFWRFFIGPFLTPALLLAFAAVRRKRLRPWLWLSAAFVLDHATYHAWYPQQSASETVLILLLLIEGWRQLRTWQWGVTFSRTLAIGFAAALLFLCLGLPFATTSHSGSQLTKVWDTMTASPGPREKAIRRLELAPGKHLVFVRYTANHPWYDEWVFNSADIPNSRIVFARMCSPESDLALSQAMSDRDVWIASPPNATDKDVPLVARVTPAQLLLASARQ